MNFVAKVLLVGTLSVAITFIIHKLGVFIINKLLKWRKRDISLEKIAIESYKIGVMIGIILATLLGMIIIAQSKGLI